MVLGVPYAAFFPTEKAEVGIFVYLGFLISLMTLCVYAGINAEHKGELFQEDLDNAISIRQMLLRFKLVATK